MLPLSFRHTIVILSSYFLAQCNVLEWSQFLLLVLEPSRPFYCRHATVHRVLDTAKKHVYMCVCTHVNETYLCVDTSIHLSTYIESHGLILIPQTLQDFAFHIGFQQGET